MKHSRKSKKAPKQPPAQRKLRLLGPKPVEEEEESSGSDFDPPSDPFCLVNNNQNAESQDDVDEDQEDGTEGVNGNEDTTESESELEKEEEEVQLPMKRKQVLKTANKSSFHSSPLFLLPSPFF